jgi:DNA-binding NtrC family response regulator
MNDSAALPTAKALLPKGMGARAGAAAIGVVSSFPLAAGQSCDTRRGGAKVASPPCGGVESQPLLISKYVFQSPAMRAVYRMVQRLASSEAAILLTGESGTGKEVVAEIIHSLGTNSTGPLIKVNCAALPHELVESELFGAIRGAYTGSHENRMGLFTQAEGGTLLLDEITEMPIQVQAKLLRVLQDHRFRPLGCRHEVKVDCRVVASTNRQPQEAIQAHKLRLDLYYRLSVVTIHLPPLRERREDIPPLVDQAISRYSRLTGRRIAGITPAALDRLTRFEWPGNVRQLENELHRAVLFCEKDCIDVEDLTVAQSGPASAARPAMLAASERDAIVQAMRCSAGNKVEAARLLGVSRQTLYNKIREYDLEEDTWHSRRPGGAARMLHEWEPP